MGNNNLKELEGLLDACPCLTWLKDEEGKLIYVNQLYIDISEMNKEKILGNKERAIWGEELKNGINYCSKQKIYLNLYEEDLYQEDKVIGKKGIAKDITLDKAFVGQFESIYMKLTESFLEPSYKEYIKILDSFQEIGSKIFEDLEEDFVIVTLYEKASRNINILYNKGFLKDEQLELEAVLQDKEKMDIYLTFTSFNQVIGVQDIIGHEIQELLERKKINTMIRYPIYFNNEIIGVITIYNPKQASNLYIGYLALYTGIAIKNFILNNYILKELKKEIEDKQELEMFFEISKQIMLIIDNKNNITVIGNQYKELLEADEQEICNCVKRDTELMEYLEMARKSLKNDNFLCIDKKFILNNEKTKEIRWVIKYKALYDMIILIGYDISEKKKDEEEELKLQVEMELEYIKGELLACMSNEFKTPINTILYTIDILKDLTLDNEMQKYIGFIKQNAYRLIRLINNLVDSNSIEAGQYNLNLGYYNLVEIVKNILKSIESYIDSKGINLSLEIQVEDLGVNCDPEKIERIILNLISNAIKYTPIGGQIEVIIGGSEAFGMIYIRDNGEGISKNRLSTIFERFSQCEEGLTRKREGSGMGLSIVKSLVEMQKGSISVESELGVGTEFKIAFPIAMGEVETKWQGNHRQLNKVERWNIEFSDIYE